MVCGFPENFYGAQLLRQIRSKADGTKVEKE